MTAELRAKAKADRVVVIEAKLLLDVLDEADAAVAAYRAELAAKVRALPLASLGDAPNDGTCDAVYVDELLRLIEGDES